MEKISDKILEKIEKDSVRPDPRWKFTFRNTLIFLGCAAFIILGGMAVSVALYLVSHADWDIYENLERGFYENLILTLPYAWIFLMAVFFMLAYFNFRNTRNGYRKNPLILLSGSVLGSLFLGALFFNLGMGKAVDDSLSENVPFYCGCQERMMVVWSSPEKGLLSGEVKYVRSEADFDLDDFRGRHWKVEGKNIFIRPRAAIESGSRIKIIGNQKKEDIFEAYEIRPWDPGKENRYYETDDER